MNLPIFDYTEIELRNSTFMALVSDEDADLADQRAWHLDSNGYVRGWNAGTEIWLHQAIAVRMGLTSGEVIDHINRDQLDNRRSNLRRVTQLENSRNRAPGSAYATH